MRLGLSMVFLQFAIGALNDIVDATADAGRVPPKPIPGGILTTAQARVVVVAAGAIGLALAASSGPALLVLGVIVLAVGAAYDLFAKGTAWSWLPFAVGIPLLPVFGAVGATGSVPGSFAILVPMAVLAGAGLAVANARADLDVDAAAGTTSVATRLGPRWSWWVDLALLGGATVLGFTVRGPVRLVGADDRAGDRRHGPRRCRAPARTASGPGRATPSVGGPGDRGGDRGDGLGRGDDPRTLGLRQYSTCVSRSRPSGPGRSRSRAEASRSSGTWPGCHGRHPRSTGPRQGTGARRRAHRAPRPGTPSH